MKKRLYMRRLKRMLERPDPCVCCPACNNYRGIYFVKGLEKDWEETCCFCRSLVGVKKYCPCGDLGTAEALKRAHKAIKSYEKRYGIEL